MLTVQKHGILLEKTNNGFENVATFNPAVIQVENYIHVFYRAVRNNNYSTIGHCILNGPVTIHERKIKPVLFPEKTFESQGCEDPRITKIEDVYYITYSAYDKINVFGTYATSSDLKTFTKHNIITPKITYREYKYLIECCTGLSEKYMYHYKLFKDHGLGKELAEKLYVWDKNIVLFPKKINGKFALLHRIYPGIQIVYFNDFSDLTVTFWKNYMMNLESHIVMDPKFPHESSHIGGGCPPIETEKGWLLIYHSAEVTANGFIYHASAALLDLKKPQKELARLNYPLISPSKSWEKEGVVNNVIFPSGAVIIEDTLYIYYGAADSRIAVASLKINELLTELLK